MEVAPIEIVVMERELEKCKYEGATNGIIIGWYLLEKIVEELRTLQKLEKEEK